MGKKSSTTTTQYGNTTTSNPYATATTNNSGTNAVFQPDTALESVYNFVNNNINSLLEDYLNPNLNSVTNQAKLKAYTNALDSTSRASLENNVINPLSQRNMLRSSQASDLYRNLSNQQTASLNNYIADLLSSAQSESASMLNNLLQMYLQGYDVISDMSSKSLQTSTGNATKTTETNNSSLVNLASKLAEIAAASYLKK